MDIISFATDKDAFLAALGRAPFTAPTVDQFALNTAYMAHYNGDAFRDLSFIVARGDDIKAIVPCALLNKVLTYTTAGIRAYYAQDEKKLLRAIYENLLALAAKNTADNIIIDDPCISPEISFWGYESYKYNAVPTAILNAEIDLTLTADDIHRGVRDSYRSLITQARKTLSITPVTTANVTPGIFDEFREFHARVAGRVTRPRESWDMQYEMVKSGCAELIMAHMEPHGLVSASLFTDYADVTTYAVAVYNRDLFDLPLAHALVYDGIFRAKDRGQKRFFLGPLPPENRASEKEISIARFKKGFCDRPRLSLQWTITPSAAKENA